MAKYWVFTIGLQDQPPPPEWLIHWGHHRDRMLFPAKKRPVAVSAGDRAVIYGSQGTGFLAAVEVLSHEPEANTHEETKDRFPFALRHRLIVAKVADEHVASPEAAGIPIRRVQRGPHTEISRAEYERAVAELLQAAGEAAS